jgi:hypothetical protein
MRRGHCCVLVVAFGRKLTGFLSMVGIDQVHSVVGILRAVYVRGEEFSSSFEFSLFQLQCGIEKMSVQSDTRDTRGRNEEERNHVNATDGCFISGNQPDRLDGHTA